MSLEQAIEANTAAVQELIAALRAAPPATKSCDPRLPLRDADHAQEPAKSPAKEKVADTPASKAKPAITYDVLKVAFLALIRQLGSAEAAKAAALTPLGLVDLKSNESKPDLFPAIMEKIEQAKGAA